MGITSSVKKFTRGLLKYRYAALVVIIGLLLMAIPKQAAVKKDSGRNEINTPQPIPTLEEKLCNTLGKINGAGEVYVMLTADRGEEILYQTDVDRSTGNDSESSRYTTVTLTDSERNETGLIRQTLPPLYRGAIILCSGGDDPTVRLAIVDAVSKVTGLKANQISVLKMK